MPAKDIQPMRKITIRLYETDLDLLRMAYQSAGYNQVIRSLVARHARRLRNITGEKLADSEALSAEELSL